MPKAIKDALQMALAIKACHALVDVYHAGSEDGDHPGEVDWSDLDAAALLAGQATGRVEELGS